MYGWVLNMGSAYEYLVVGRTCYLSELYISQRVNLNNW